MKVKVSLQSAKKEFSLSGKDNKFVVSAWSVDLKEGANKIDHKIESKIQSSVT